MLRAFICALVPVLCVLTIMKHYSPTTPSRRHMTGYDFSRLSKIEPLKSATKGLIRSWGRNNKGRITSKYRGGGAKRSYREIDFKQDKINVPGKVFSIEYDPNRTTRIARINYADGDKRYILAPQDLKARDEIITAEKAPLRSGNRMKLKNIPQGSLVQNVELRHGQGGKLIRSAGSGAKVLASERG